MRLAKRSFEVLSISCLFLSGCETTNPHETLDIKAPVSSLKANKAVQPQIAHAFVLLKEEKYSEASTFINKTLQSQPKSVIFHILNALTYEKLAEHGDPTGIELAEIGYQNAINLDPFNKFAITQMGKIKYRSQRFDQAQEHFAHALNLKPNDPDLIHEFAAASYYAYDIKTALAAIQRALTLKPEEPLIQRSAAMMYAAVGDFKAAEKHFKLFQAKLGQDPEVDHVENRFRDWQHLYKSGRLTLAAAQSSTQSPTSESPPSPDSDEGDTQTGNPDSDQSGLSVDDAPPPGESDEPTAQEFMKGNLGANIVDVPVTPGIASSPAGRGQPTSKSKKVLQLPKGKQAPTNPQIILDCYLIEMNEEAKTSKGNNILNTLAVTLSPGSFTKFSGNMKGTGSSLPNPSFGQSGNDNVSGTGATGFATAVDSTGKVINGVNGGGITTNLNTLGSISGRIFTSGITWAGLTYSLNIANAIDNRTEIISRPTLMTHLKKESRFFSGSELINVGPGSYGSNLSRYQVGISVSVTPHSLEGELVTLDIGLETSNLQSLNPNLLQTVDVGKTRLETTARVHLGETIMLGGLYRREELQGNSGFPGLRDVPIIQYFFANESTSSSRRSIAILITPRSPELVKAAVNRGMTQESIKPHFSELIARNPDWFHPRTNATYIFSYLNLDPSIYYEFRTGDILPPSWGYEPALSDKLAELSSFLYF